MLLFRSALPLLSRKIPSTRTTKKQQGSLPHLYPPGLRLYLLEVLHEQPVEQERVHRRDAEGALARHAAQSENLSLSEVQRQHHAAPAFLLPRQQACSALRFANGVNNVVILRQTTTPAQTGLGFHGQQILLILKPRRAGLALRKTVSVAAAVLQHRQGQRVAQKPCG